MAELVGCRSGWGGDIGELLNKSGDGVAVALEGFAFVVSEVELLEHLLDPSLDL